MGFVDVPIFTGNDVRSWITWMERYFARCDDITELQKQAMAFGFIEGDALRWYYQREFETWNDLRKALLMKYGDDGDPERYWLLAEQDRLRKRLRSSAIQSESAKAITTLESICVAERTPKADSIFPTDSRSAASASIVEAECVAQSEVSHSFMEPGLSDKMLGDLETNMVIEDQQQVVSEGLSDVLDDLRSAVSELCEKSTCVDSTTYAFKVFDNRILRGHRLQHQRKRRISPKSWQFKYKNGMIKQRKQKFFSRSWNFQFKNSSVTSDLVPTMLMNQFSFLDRHVFLRFEEQIADYMAALLRDNLCQGLCARQKHQRRKKRISLKDWSFKYKTELENFHSVMTEQCVLRWSRRFNH
ncbi:hypothetical protein EUTSA_v10029176mg [Eutrema salsugineum]|uniref:Retrotransposon gag domain-containing protein n=1 Tax=Eutrema salsugineum TaxID=72664 RepID=V4L4X3_EUTSA|nr:hypothetical protein EUTSA_v10029176mg [Eutrema salsugineum]